MQITIVLDTDFSADVAALTALVASLGGRTVVTAPQPAAPITPHPIADSHSSEHLLANEAARVAGEPTGGTNGGEDSPSLDSSGLPWDERIHSLSGDGSRPQNANGTWRRKRGVADDLVAQVESELRGDKHPSEPAAVPVPPPPPSDATAPITAPPAPPVTPVAADTASGQPAATTAGEATVSTDGPRFPTYADLVRACTGKAIDYSALNAVALELFGVSKFIDLRDRPDTWDMFFDSLPA